jgi:hypothetical protein
LGGGLDFVEHFKGRKTYQTSLIYLLSIYSMMRSGVAITEIDEQVDVMLPVNAPRRGALKIPIKIKKVKK